MDDNKWWANYNLFLMMNTGISLFQGLVSFFLVAETPTYMKMLKPVRAFSYGIAIFYNLIYTWFLIEAITDVTDAIQTHGAYNWSKMFMDLMYGFLLALHLPIAMENMVIILKELNIEHVYKNR